MDRDVVAEAALAWKMRRQDPPASVREIAEALACSMSSAHCRLQMAAESDWLQALLSGRPRADPGRSVSAAGREFTPPTTTP